MTEKRDATSLADPTAPRRVTVRPQPSTQGTASGIEPPTLAPATPQIEVSVLVPVLNEQEHLQASVAAMLAQDLDGTFELLFVDGRSDDRTVAMLTAMQESDPRIRVLDNPHRTTAHALNIGLRAARGRYVARMDAHTEYPTGYLRHGMARLTRGDVDWVTGPQIPCGRGRWSRLVAVALSGGLGRGASDKWQADDADAPTREWNLTTSVFTGVWRRDTLDALGGWDPEWPVNQDSEMAARVLARGGRIVCRSDMGAHYVPRNSPARLGRQYWRYGRYRARTFLRHPTSCGPVRLAAAGLPVGLSCALLPGRIGRVGRWGAALYALAVTGQVTRIRPAARDAGPLAAVLVTMHVSWAAGFLASLTRLWPQRTAIRAATPGPLVRPTASR